jgi:L-glyceraldehyde 3-phosphate reductase
VSYGAFEKTYAAADDRYDKIEYRRTGNSGLDLPAFSFGLWQKFGTDYPYETQREIVLHAFDLGITHFDNADRYGPPHRAAQQFFGRVLSKDLAPYREELILSTKAGNPIGPSPYQKGGSRKSLLVSLERRLLLKRRFEPAVARPERRASRWAQCRRVAVRNVETSSCMPTINYSLPTNGNNG